MPTRVQILVFRGRKDDSDFRKTRHAALFFMFMDGSSSVLHVEGYPSRFAFEQLDNSIPEGSRKLERRVDVGEIHDIFSKQSILNVVSSTPVKKDLDWNCQSWVGDALKRMVQNQFLTESERNDGLETMVDILFEAENEPMWY